MFFKESRVFGVVENAFPFINLYSIYHYKMLLDVDACIETLKSGECVTEQQLRQLCQYVSELLMEESNVQPVLSPVTIVGDLHGQFFDLLHLFGVGGWPPETSYVFLGDFVDRGHNSVETLSLLLCLRLTRTATTRRRWSSTRC